MKVPFRYLGFKPAARKNWQIKHFFILPFVHGPILVLKENEITRRGLLSIAPLAYWERNYGSKERIEWDSAISDVLSASYQAGIYIGPVGAVAIGSSEITSMIDDDRRKEMDEIDRRVNEYCDDKK